MNAQCTLIYDLPKDHRYKTFRALCGYDSSCDKDNTSASGTTMDFQFYVTENAEYTFDLTQLGYGADEEVPVHDVWAKRDVGVAKGTIKAVVPSHGVKLYRLGDKVASGIEDAKGETASDAAQKARAAGACHNLEGQSVKPNASGIYILNQKKVLVK